MREQLGLQGLLHIYRHAGPINQERPKVVAHTSSYRSAPVTLMVPNSNGFAPELPILARFERKVSNILCFVCSAGDGRCGGATVVYASRLINQLRIPPHHEQHR